MILAPVGDWYHCQVGGRSPVLSCTRNLSEQNEAGLPCGLAGYWFKNVLHVLSFLGYENESRPRHQKNGVCESLTLPSSRWLSHCHMPWKTPIVDLWVLGTCRLRLHSRFVYFWRIWCLWHQRDGAGDSYGCNRQCATFENTAPYSTVWRSFNIPQMKRNFLSIRCTFFAIINGPIIS